MRSVLNVSAQLSSLHVSWFAETWTDITLWLYVLNKELGLIWIASLCRNSLSLAKGPKRPREVGVVWGGPGVGWGWSVGVIPKRGQNKYMWRLEDGSYQGGGGVAVALM